MSASRSSRNHVKEGGVKAPSLAEANMPAHLSGEISFGQLWQRWRMRLAMAPGSLVTFLIVGIVAGSASVLSVVLSNTAAPSVLALHLFGTIGIVWLAVTQWRALWQANVVRRDALARADRLERELARHEYVEESWPHQEERYRTPLDQIQDYTIFLLDVDGVVTSWNPGVQRVLGYQREEFLKRSVDDFYTPQDQEEGAPARELREAAKRGRTSSDRWVVRKDGSRFWASTSTASVHDRRGRLLGYARRLRDLSQKKQSEEQLRRKQAALELALEAAGLGTWEYDFTSGTMYWDERAKSLLGLSPDAPMTLDPWLESLHPEDRREIEELWKKALLERLAFSAEYRVIWPDSSVHWIMAVGRCTSDITGEPFTMSGVVLDLTERRQAEEHLQETLRLEAVGRLAGGIAHDLNNMLAAILGFCEFLHRGLEANDPRRMDVEQISLAADRSANLTRQLLAFARRELIQPQVLDVNTIVRRAAAMFPSILGENIELVLELAPQPGLIYADPHQIEQTLMNLVLNARDAMPRGGHVIVETKPVNLDPNSARPGNVSAGIPGGSFTMLAVTDTGHGMDAATLQRIWEPFFTTKPPGQGTGLGLSSVYGTVKQSGGFVWAESELERGTTVQVYWPQTGSHAETVVQSTELSAVQGGSETILIVEDEDLVRALGVRVLKGEGYRCYEARNAKEALQLLEDEGVHVDLIITDVVMPGMSGGGLGDRLELLRPGVPILFTSAFTDEDVIRRGLLAKDRPFLQKPSTPQELARMVRKVLDAAASSRQSGPVT
jgi:two-component system, cell cycle sensor histidine kinase and response regulator CckA